MSVSDTSFLGSVWPHFQLWNFVLCDWCMCAKFVCRYLWINLWTLLVWHGCHATRLQGRILPKMPWNSSRLSLRLILMWFWKTIARSLYSLLAKRLETAPGRVRLWRRDASRNASESTRFGRRSVVHRFAMHFASTIMMTMKNLVKPNAWRLIKFEK